MSVRRSWVGAAALTVVMTTAWAGVGQGAGGASGATVTIDDPGQIGAGTVTLTGRVGVRSGDITSVVYVVDATNSTAAPTGSDCSGNGSVGADDDLNGDGNVGDILDCEIAGVTALNASLAATSGLQVGLVGFANQAAPAAMDPSGTRAFVAPGLAGADGQRLVDAVARSVDRGRIGQYVTRNLGGSGAGSAFNNAIEAALDTLGGTPDGPRWIMFLSDGQSPIDDALLARLSASGIRLRSFGIGADATCSPSSSLYKMAVSTGEQCVLAPVPAALAVQLSGAVPDAVSSLAVTIGHVSVAGVLDAVGGWKAPFTLGAGTYVAGVRAVMTSGAVVTAQRTFSVAASAESPPPGTISAGPGALLATGLEVATPRPTRAFLPARVSGTVGRVATGLSPDQALTGSVVRLQARRAAGAPWTTVDRDRVSSRGRFSLGWEPVRRYHVLRVVLVPPSGFAGSASVVPEPPISACRVVHRAARGWTLTCRTTAVGGSTARLLRRGHVIDRSQVRRATIELHGRGKVSAHRVALELGHGRHVRLAL